MIEDHQLLARRSVLKTTAALGAALVARYFFSSTKRAFPANSPNPVPRSGTTNLMTRAEAFGQQLVDTGVVNGCTVAAVDVEQGVRGVASFGSADAANGVPFTNHTLLAIESVTKVFTATLFALAVNAGVVAADDYIDKYLPRGVKLHHSVAHRITLEMLANYTSQFPNSPDNYPPVHADYTLLLFKEYLNNFKCKHPSYIGTKYQYSSFGFALLGWILVNLAGPGASFESLVKSQITRPLAMGDTVVTPSGDQLGRLATGYSNGVATPEPRDPLFLGGAGALFSTGYDMLIFLETLVRADAPPTLQQAFNLTEKPTFWRTEQILKPPSSPGHQSSLATPQIKAVEGRAVGLAWGIDEPFPDVLTYNKDGGGGGFNCLLAFVPVAGRGLFVGGNMDSVEFLTTLQSNFPTLLGYALSDD